MSVGIVVSVLILVVLVVECAAGWVQAIYVSVLCVLSGTKRRGQQLTVTRQSGPLTSEQTNIVDTGRRRGTSLVRQRPQKAESGRTHIQFMTVYRAT